MKSGKIIYSSVDEYIASFPAEVQNILTKLRKAIKAAAPDVQERISYQMPAFSQNGILVYFAAFKNHIGFYPTSSGIRAFKKSYQGIKPPKARYDFQSTNLYHPI